MWICPQCGRRFPADATRCPDHGDRALLRLGDAEKDPLIGVLVDERYIVLDVVGEGGMGTVYKAWQRRVNREVAIKTMRIRGDGAKLLRERFVREAEVTAQLKSPHTVTVHDSGELPDGTLYMVMEFLGGRTLADVLGTDGKLDLPRVRKLAVHACDSLAEAHALGLVHRDIKPQNLALTTRADGDEWLTVLDFGIVKPVDAGAAQLTREGAAVGSLLTMSPEQIDGRGVSVASDIYGLGATMFHLATGRPVFMSPTALGLMAQHMSATPPRLAETLGERPLVSAFDAILQRCLKKRPAERFQDVDALRRALEALPTDTAAPAPRPPRPVANRRLSRVGMQAVEPGGDPASLPGVSADAVHRRITETRLQTASDPAKAEGATGPPPARVARWVLAGLAAAIGLYIILDGLF
ncbi:MAG: serine/threonine protein kinase [Myxococcales bacterium]|nr:serine/threonine protein kinase [Myxococcales bacterium]MCB9734753.1 serine/threonine protein kinase [Deltaproteobacteria bacterium]